MKHEMKEITQDTELLAIHGGFWPPLLAGALIASVAYVSKGVVDNWAEFKEGVSQGYNTFS